MRVIQIKDNGQEHANLSWPSFKQTKDKKTPNQEFKIYTALFEIPKNSH
jgi:hypothetical protein